MCIRDRFLPILYPTKTFHPNNFPVHVCIGCICLTIKNTYTVHIERTIIIFLVSTSDSNICFTQHFCSNSEVVSASNRLFIIGSYHCVLIILGRRIHLIGERHFMLHKAKRKSWKWKHLWQFARLLSAFLVKEDLITAYAIKCFRANSMQQDSKTIWHDEMGPVCTNFSLSKSISIRKIKDILFLCFSISRAQKYKAKTQPFDPWKIDLFRQQHNATQIKHTI